MIIQSVLLVSALIFAMYMGGQIDISNMEKDAKKFWKQEGR